MDRVSNEEVRRRTRIEMELAIRADQRPVRWFGHVERMDEYRMARRVLMGVSGGQVRGRSRLGWKDGVKVAFGNRGVSVVAARQCAKDRKEWRALAHLQLLLGPMFFRTALPCSGGYHLEGGAMPLHDAVVRNCKKRANTENQDADVKYMGYEVYFDDCECVSSDLTLLPLLGGGRTSWYIIYYDL